MEKGMNIKAFLSHEVGRREVRRFTIPPEHVTDFRFILSKVKNIFGINQDIALSWQDEEGDMVTICSDEEMAVAVDECITQQQQKLFKIFVKLSHEVESTSTPQQCEKQPLMSEEPSSTLLETQPSFNATEIQVESCVTVKEEQYESFQNSDEPQEKHGQHPSYEESFPLILPAVEMEEDAYVDMRKKLSRCLEDIDENQNSISAHEVSSNSCHPPEEGQSFFPERTSPKREPFPDTNAQSDSDCSQDGSRMPPADLAKGFAESSYECAKSDPSNGEHDGFLETKRGVLQEGSVTNIPDEAPSQSRSNLTTLDPVGKEPQSSVPGLSVEASTCGEPPTDVLGGGASIIALEEIPEEIQQEIQQLEAGFQGGLFVEEGLVSQTSTAKVKTEKKDEDLAAAASYILGDHPLMPPPQPVINQYETEILAQLQPIINMACNEKVIIRSNTCPECQMECADKEEFVTHWTSHLDSKPYKCLECNYRSYQVKLVENHMFSHYKVKRFRCKLCSFKTSKNDLFKGHLLSHGDLKPFKCSQCDAAFPQKRGLTVHMYLHTGEKPFKCPECPAAYVLKEHLKKHSLKHSGVKPFKCVWCARQFAHKFSLKFHMYRHLKLKPYKCAECEMQFTQKGHLNSHMLTHSQVKPFKCTECGAGFNRKESMKRHVLSHSKVKEHKCPECPAEFALKGSLKRHALSHRNPQKHVCIVCNVEFGGRDLLREHMTIHRGKKPFRCDPCNAEFTQKGSLKRHLMRHGKRRNYACPSCDMVFKQKGFYNKHLLTHTDPALHVCATCNMQFKTKEYLRRHSVIHMETKPHKCPVCSAEFTQKWNLKRHMYVHTGIKPFKCTECDKAYIQRQQLKEHMLVHMNFDD